MNSVLKHTIATLAVAATTLSAMPANAGDWRYGGYGNRGGYSDYDGYRGHRDRYVEKERRHYKKRKKHDKDDLIAAGVIGLAVGALAAGALASQPQQRVYAAPPPAYQPRPRYNRDYYPAQPARSTSNYSEAGEPWTREWYRSCRARYRSFDSETGTFMGYDGIRRFCQP